jgi:hypothetical protein
MTYQHSKAPADAPVTWDIDCGLHIIGNGICVDLDNGSATCDDADAICLAFHLAKLAEEAQYYMECASKLTYDDGSETKDAHDAADWLRRFRAAKGDA